MSQKVLLEIRGLAKTYGKIKAVDNLSMSVNKGDIYGFLGPNGSGKTTTIRIILGLISADSGYVRVNGKDINKDFKKYVSNVGAIVETPTFYGYLSGYDNLNLMANLTPGIKKGRIEEVLEIVGLKGREGDKVRTYSLGMKQRLGIAQALLSSPELLILDEPTNGLDPYGMKEIRDMVKRLAREQGITFILSSHLLNEMQQVCNRVCIIKKGHLVKEDYVENLIQTRNEVVEIHTPDKQLACDVLKKSGLAVCMEEIRKGISVTIESGMSAKINQCLFSNNVRVNYAVPKNGSLEELFFELTGGQ